MAWQVSPSYKWALELLGEPVPRNRNEVRQKITEILVKNGLLQEEK